MKAFSLIGVDGNAFSIMGYTAKALKKLILMRKLMKCIARQQMETIII